MGKLLGILLIVLLAIVPAAAQTGFGNIPSGTMLGNNSAAQAEPFPIPLSAAAGNVAGIVADWNGSTGTDNAAAFQAQLTANCVLLIPPGRYRLASGLSTTCRSLSIKGSGVNATQLVFNGAIATGISIDHTAAGFNQLSSVQISDLTIATTQAPGGTAIALAGFNNVSEYLEHGQLYVSNVQIIGNAQYTQGWASGLSLTDVHNAYIVNTNITGMGGNVNTQAALTQSTNGILVAGTTSVPFELHVTNSGIYNVATGLAISGTMQGIYVTNTDIVNVLDGIVFPASSGELLIIGDSHIAAFRNGINVSGIAQVNIHDILFIADTRGTQAGNQVQLVNTIWAHVHHNHFWSINTAHPGNGVFLGASVNGANVVDNIYENGVPSSFSTGITINADIANTNINVDTNPNSCSGAFTLACVLINPGTGPNVNGQARITDTAAVLHQWFKSVAGGIVTATQPAYVDISGGAAPTSVTACGTSPAVIGGNSAGKITTGSTATTACTLNFSVSFGAAPFCVANAQGATVTAINATPATGSVTFNYASSTSLVFSYFCAGT